MELVRCTCTFDMRTCPEHPRPRWDDSLAGLLETNDTHMVEYEVHMANFGTSVVVRKTVTRRADRARDRHVVWCGDVVSKRKAGLGTFIGLLVDALAIG